MFTEGGLNNSVLNGTVSNEVRHASYLDMLQYADGSPPFAMDLAA